MNVLVATVAGSFAVDLETDEVEPWDGEVSPPPAPRQSETNALSEVRTASGIDPVEPLVNTSFLAPGSRMRTAFTSNGLSAGRSATPMIERAGP